MINIRKSVIYVILALSALVMTSCQQDDTLYYNNMTMGNVVDGRFISDQGNVFNVVSQDCGGNLSTEKRAMVMCDVLNETAGAVDEYDVHLINYSTVLDKDAVALENASEGEISVQDPIVIEQLWYSGGYLNMLIRFQILPDSETKHLINLVHSKDAEGKYILNLRHNAYDETYAKQPTGTMIFKGGGYVSFPIVKFVKEDQAKIVLKWNGYETTEGGYGYDFTKEKEYSYTYDWKRSGYEQAPNKTTQLY